MNRYIILLIFVLFMSHASLYGQRDSSSHVAYEDDLYKLEVVVLHDTIYIKDTMFVSQLNDITRLFNMTFDEYSHKLLQAVEKKDSAEILSLERIYLNYLLPMYYPSFIKHRYIARNYTVDVNDNKLDFNTHTMRNPLFDLQDSLDMDVMLICRGDVNTNNFLKSPDYRSSCLEQLFLSIYDTKMTKIKGVNLYFPDFSFKEKRAMAQFVKSASLIIDSCRVQDNKKFNLIRNLKLYVTFDKEKGIQNKDFLYCLSQMSDSILLVNSKIEGWPRDSIEIITKTDAANSSWFVKVVNQLYLARFNFSPFPETSNTELNVADLRQLANSDYPDNNWEIYLFILCIIFIIIIIVAATYRFVPSFSYFVNNNIAYFFSLIIILMLEIYLLFVCMIEAMSKEQVFTFGGENKNTLLLMPLLFTFIIPMLNIISKSKEKP